MPKETFKKGKLVLTYDLNDSEDKFKKIKRDLTKGKKQLTDLNSEELELIVAKVISQ